MSKSTHLVPGKCSPTKQRVLSVLGIPCPRGWASLCQLSVPLPGAQALHLSHGHRSVCLLASCRVTAAYTPHHSRLWLLAGSLHARSWCLSHSRRLPVGEKSHCYLHSVLHGLHMRKEILHNMSEALHLDYFPPLPASPTLLSEYSFHPLMTMGDSGRLLKKEGILQDNVQS